MQPVVIPYPTEPVEVILSDGKARSVRFTAGALKRAGIAVKALGEGAEELDVLICQLFHGIVEKDDLTIEALYELVDARAVPYLGEQLAKALPENPTSPVSKAAN